MLAQPKTWYRVAYWVLFVVQLYISECSWF